jgi:hypothetical protein
LPSTWDPEAQVLLLMLILPILPEGFEPGERRRGWRAAWRTRELSAERSARGCEAVVEVEEGPPGGLAGGGGGDLELEARAEPIEWLG